MLPKRSAEKIGGAQLDENRSCGSSCAARDTPPTGLSIVACLVMITPEFDNPSPHHYNTPMNTPFPGMDPYLEHPIT